MFLPLLTWRWHLISSWVWPVQKYILKEQKVGTVERRGDWTFYKDYGKVCLLSVNVLSVLSLKILQASLGLEIMVNMSLKEVCLCVCVLLFLRGYLAFLMSNFGWNYSEMSSRKHPLPIFSPCALREFLSLETFMVFPDHEEACLNNNSNYNNYYYIFYYTLSTFSRGLYTLKKSSLHIIRILKYFFLWKYPKWFCLHFIIPTISHANAGIVFDDQFILNCLSYTYM